MCFAVALLQSFLVLQVYVPASKDFSLDIRYCICASECVNHHSLSVCKQCLTSAIHCENNEVCAWLCCLLTVSCYAGP